MCLRAVLIFAISSSNTYYLPVEKTVSIIEEVIRYKGQKVHSHKKHPSIYIFATDSELIKLGFHYYSVLPSY